METSTSQTYLAWGADNIAYGPVELPPFVTWIKQGKVTAQTWVYKTRDNLVKSLGYHGAEGAVQIQAGTPQPRPPPTRWGSNPAPCAASRCWRTWTSACWRRC